MSIQEQATQMIKSLSDDNVVFLIDFMKRFMLPETNRTDSIADFKPEVIEAMEEAKKLSRDPNTKKYASFSEALEDLEL